MLPRQAVSQALSADIPKVALVITSTLEVGVYIPSPVFLVVALQLSLHGLVRTVVMQARECARHDTEGWAEWAVGVKGRPQTAV